MSERDDIAWELRRGQYRVSLKYDNEPRDPREDGAFGTFVLPHRNYTIGDTESSDSVVSAVLRAIDEVRGPFQERIIARYLTCWWGAKHVFGVHLYEHGGITVSTSGIPSVEAAADHRNGHPDGYIFDQPGSEEDWEPDDPAAALIREVEDYASYCERDVYGVVVERYTGGEDDEVEEEDDFEELQAVWNYVGMKYAREQAMWELNSYIENDKQRENAA